jgi:hypothetical protein
MLLNISIHLNLTFRLDSIVIIGKMLIWEFTIFNTKVLKIEGFGFREISLEIERNQRRHR